MTKTKKRLLFISIVILVSLVLSFAIISLFAPKPMLHGDYPYYPEVKDIVEASDIIIVGEVITDKNVEELMVDKTPNKTDKETIPYTISTIKISVVVKGNVHAGDTITVKQLGDYRNRPEETLYEMDGYLKKGTEQLVFLCEYADSPYSPVNPAQGIVEVRDGYLYSNNRFSLFGFSSSSKESTDTLSNAIETINEFVD